MSDEIDIPQDETIVTVRDAAAREIDVRLVPFNKTISLRSGAEEFAPGSVSGTPDNALFLMGLEHAAELGIGQDGQPVVKRTPTGRSLRVWEQDDGAYATFKVARTQAGDDILALAEDGIIRGVSVEFDGARSVTEKITRAGRRINRITRAALTGAALTYRPAYGEQAAVLAIRSSEEGQMAEDQPVQGVTFTQEDKNALIAAMSSAVNTPIEGIMARLEAIEDNARKDVTVPQTRTEDRVLPSKGEWMHLWLRAQLGEIIPGEQMRTIDDVVTGDNLGVVPPAYLTEIIGIIDRDRPFLQSTRRLDLPNSGMSVIVPKINQRPEVGIQDPEKEEVASQKTLIGTETFTFRSIAGAGDLSIQILRRSSPSFLGLWLDLLAEAYAQFAEDVALDALANAAGGWGTGNTIDPDSLSLGNAFITSFDAMRRPPDTIWLSTQAIAEFIDAKATTTNQPLYPGLQPSATAGGGITGVISGLRAVHVPTLDDHGAKAIVGPSAGFAWVEDGPLTLQADVPHLAGRDVGIVGLLCPIPWYPDAFTIYNVAS